MDSPDTGSLLVAWVAAPLLIAALSVALGFLVLRAAGSDWFIFYLPLGFLTGIWVTVLVLAVGAPGWVAGVIVGALAVAGVALAVVDAARGGLRRPSGSTIAAASLLVLVVYLAGMAPLIAGGNVGVIGFEVLNDSAAHISMTDYLFHTGANHRLVESTYERLANDLLNASYPLGRYAWPVIAMTLTGADAFDLYSPIVAVGMAVSALVGMSVLMRVGMPAWGAALAGAVGAVGYLQFSYALEGSDRDLIFAASVFGLFLAATLIERRRPFRSALPALVMLAGSFAVAGPLIGIWIALAIAVAASVLVARAVRGRSLPRPGRLGRRRAAFALVASAVLAGLAAWALVDAADFVSSFSKSRNQAGNMVRPVPLAELTNFSFAIDFRDPVRFPVVTYLLGALAVVLAAVGVASLWRRRAWYAIAPLAFGAVAAGVMAAISSPYFVTKLYLVIAMGIALCASTGVWAIVLRGRRWRAAGIAMAAVGLAGVAASDYCAYAGARVTPAARFREARDIDRRFAGLGTAVVTENDLYLAYLLRDVPAVVVPVNSDDRIFPGHRPLGRGRVADLKQFSIDGLAMAPLIVERSGPLKSTPPPEYELAFEGDAYRVWRLKPGGTTPLDFVSFGGEDFGIGPLDCDRQDVRRLIRGARARGELVVVRRAGKAPLIMLPLDPRFEQAGEWKAVSRDGVIFLRNTSGSGSLSTAFEAPPGTYSVWLRGSFGSGVEVLMDGRVVGAATSPAPDLDQFEFVGRARISRGPNTVEIRVMRRDVLEPGNARPNEVALLVLDPEERAGMGRETRAVEPSRLEEVMCGEEIDWIASQAHVRRKFERVGSGGDSRR